MKCVPVAKGISRHCSRLCQHGAFSGVGAIVASLVSTIGVPQISYRVRFWAGVEVAPILGW